MTDLELFKEIVRATTGVPAENVGKAVAKVRALFGTVSTSQEIEGRGSPATRNRKYLGGMDRSGDDAA